MKKWMYGVILVFMAVVGAYFGYDAYAYYTDEAFSETSFQMGSVGVALVEADPFSQAEGELDNIAYTKEKTFWGVNQGTKDVIVRAKLSPNLQTSFPSGFPDEYSSKTLFDFFPIKGNYLGEQKLSKVNYTPDAESLKSWIPGGDGYYYYKYVLKGYTGDVSPQYADAPYSTKPMHVTLSGGTVALLGDYKKEPESSVYPNDPTFTKLEPLQANPRINVDPDPFYELLVHLEAAQWNNKEYATYWNVPQSVIDQIQVTP